MRKGIYCILYVPILYILGLSIPSSGLYSLCSIQNEWLYQITLILSYVMDNVGGILNIFFSSLSFYFFSSPHLFLLGIITTVQLRICLWPSDQMWVTCLFQGCFPFCSCFGQTIRSSPYYNIFRTNDPIWTILESNHLLSFILSFPLGFVP